MIPDAYREYRKEWYHRNKERTISRVRHNYLKRLFGISLEEYNQLHTQQEGVCKICAQPETQIDPRNSKPRSLAVDHCHLTKKVRGLLCLKCNTALGKFGDSSVLLEKALIYLKESS